MPVSTVQSLHSSHCKRHHLGLLQVNARCAVWVFWHHAMHFVIPVCLRMTFVHSRFPGMKKTGPGMHTLNKCQQQSTVYQPLVPSKHILILNVLVVKLYIYNI